MDMQEGRKGIPSLLSSQGECIASNITQLIGWTPLIELKNIVMKDGINARLIGKFEPYQPLSSLKDRSALRLIEDAEDKSLISPGITTLVAVTSGNLGIGVAFVAAQKGYKFIAVMPAKIAIDKQILLRYLGVEVILVDPAINGFKGLLDRVEQLKNEMENVYVVDQFTNPSNPDAHFRWTGPEIWKDTEGKVDIFVSASGSGGTLTGTGRYLKMKNPSVRLVCVEPAESSAISGGEPAYHKIQGIGPGFVPEILDTSQIDEIITVTAQEAMDMARRLAREEGLLVGISSGTNAAACLKVAAEENKGRVPELRTLCAGERRMCQHKHGLLNVQLEEYLCKLHKTRQCIHALLPIKEMQLTAVISSVDEAWTCCQIIIHQQLATFLYTESESKSAYADFFVGTLDHFSWKFTQSGLYTSKSAYATLFVETIKIGPWRRIRKSWAPRCKFIWLVFHNQCWTADRLAKRGLAHPVACPLCDQAEETIHHLLIGCVFTRQIWAMIVISWAYP